MTAPRSLRFDPALDLKLERMVDIPPKAIWDAWTKPALLKQWFTPVPWKTVGCSIELRPGGAFRSVMRSPEGVAHVNEGCYLEVIPGKRLVWTNAMVAGFRPVKLPPDGVPDSLGFAFTAILTLTPRGKGTRYVALVRHATVEGRQRHEAMGFHAGWSAALDQLVAMVKRRGSKRRR
jgi:uncharacterized protein YndB with AHSA1/START domain